MVEARIQCSFASQSSYLLQDQARGAYLLSPCHLPASPVVTDKRVIYWHMSGNPLFCGQEAEMSLPLREMLPPVQQVCKYNNFLWCASFGPAKGFLRYSHSGNDDRHHFSVSRHQFDKHKGKFKKKVLSQSRPFIIVLNSIHKHTCICSRLSTPINSPISSCHTCTIQFRRECWFHLNYIL